MATRTIQARPRNFPDGIVPAMVLGTLAACSGKAVIDPGTGGSAGGTTTSSSSSSGTTSTTLTGTEPCAGLQAEYAQALAAAQLCDPMVNALQCTLMVDDKLDCPCSTYVNPANAAAVAELDSLASQWAAAQCNTGCPPVSCPDIQGAGCSGSGKCEIYLPD